MTATALPRVVYCVRPESGVQGGGRHGRKTCAACDCELDANAIKVTVGGKTVEVCCEDCAQKLKEAHASASCAREGLSDDGQRSISDHQA